MKAWLLVLLLAAPVTAEAQQAKWPAGSEVAYTIHPDHWDLPIADVISASQAADAIINAMPAGQPTLRYVGLSSVVPALGNGRSELYAVAGVESGQPTTAAMGNYWWQVTNVISEGDIRVYSGAYVWRMAGDPACTRNNIDLNILAILVHEKLHTLGLVIGAGASGGHFSPSIPGATMNATMPGTSCGREQESPEAADLAALRAVYPIQAPQTRTLDVFPVYWNAVLPTWLSDAQVRSATTAMETQYRTMSYGVFAWAVTVHAPVQITPQTICNPSGVASEALAIARARGDTFTTPHLFIQQGNSACGWSGLMTGVQTFLNGSYGSMVHELGHYLGLAHTNNSCDPMSSSGAAKHFQAESKTRLKWIAPLDISAGTYALDPFETISSGPKALRVGAFYVEFRTTSCPTPRVMVSSQNTLSVSLVAGGSHTLPDGRRLTVPNISPTGATVTLSSAVPAPRSGGRPIPKV